MLPLNIDLTADNVFSNGPTLSFGDDITPPEVLDGEMTLNEFNKISKYEFYFGKRKYANLRNQVFKKDSDTLCYHCKKDVRVPWKRYRGLCQDCYSSYYRRKIPWRMDTVGFDERGYNLFNLR